MARLRRVRRTALMAGMAILVGCSGAQNAQPNGSGTGAGPGPVSSSAVARTAVAVTGPWRAWTKSLSAREASGTCGATAHQVVCSTAPDGLVGRSRATGAVTWSVPATGTGGKNGGLVVEAADERAVTIGGRVLRAANLRTGRAAWTHRLPSRGSYLSIAATPGTVYALGTGDSVPSEGFTDLALDAFRASDGAPLWQKSVDADPTGGIAVIGNRVYTTDGKKVTARDARTGDTVATSPSALECPRLIFGGRYLVCAGSPLSAGDTFPPLRRLDPATLQPLATAEDTGMKSERGVISSDGVLVLHEDSAEDPGGGAWNAYDLERHRRLWSYDTTSDEAGLAGGRFVTFTPANASTRDRVITIDLRAGPDGTGAAAPRIAAWCPQTKSGEYPLLIMPGGDSGHVVVEPRKHRALRSIPLP
ncbi:outer membrane protein assembly factor BamB family protein [Streptomyces cellulosae]|uniref:PQQ-binding-like beta-propeller repeat protein n=1 Tax=Streptomyces cellulosae TaxID=1968 RepID=A0ABW7XZB2_STRCE